MCSNYYPVTRADRMLTFFGVAAPIGLPDQDVFPLGLAPFIRLARNDPDATPALVADTGIFGLLPQFATELAYGRRTYNARSETVHSLPSFRPAWAAGQRCIIPAEAFYEPNWETGRGVRWRISQPGDVPMGIAGLYRRWRQPDGSELATFAMLTVNADGHPVMQRFHKPGEEKRMVVILAPADYVPWLTCAVVDARSYFLPWSGPLDAEPAPLARPSKVQPVPRSGELF